MVQLDDPNLGRRLDEPESLPRMSFGDHLDELRTRVIRALLAIMVAVIAVIPFKQEVQRIIVGPYRVQWQEGFEGWIDELEAAASAASDLDSIGAPGTSSAARAALDDAERAVRRLEASRDEHLAEV